MLRNPLTDAIVVLVIVLLFFGPKRLPLLGRSLREFRDSITGGAAGEDEDAERPVLTSAPPAAAESRPAEAETSEPRA
jgi:Sec-independent protein translocase protein TatA